MTLSGSLASGKVVSSKDAERSIRMIFINELNQPFIETFNISYVILYFLLYFKK
jgi:hypothetical protein